LEGIKRRWDKCSCRSESDGNNSVRFGVDIDRDSKLISPTSNFLVEQIKGFVDINWREGFGLVGVDGVGVINSITYS
jgi:hypothetical protein